MAGGSMRAVARANLVVGLAAVCFALYAISLDPATFRELQLQMIKESDPNPPEQGQTDCAATAAEVMEMRANTVLLLLLGAAQALMAMLAAVGAMRHVGTLLATCVSIPMAWMLSTVFAGVIHVAMGRCHDHGPYHELLVAGYAIFGVSSGLLFIASVMAVVVDIMVVVLVVR